MVVGLQLDADTCLDSLNQGVTSALAPESSNVQWYRQNLRWRDCDNAKIYVDVTEEKTLFYYLFNAINNYKNNSPRITSDDQW